MITNIWHKDDVSKYVEHDDSELDIIHPVLLDMLGDVKGSRIVDYGCGEGKLMELLSERGAIMFGYDISPSMIETACQRMRGRAALAVIESGMIPLQEDSVDAVISNLVLMMCSSREMIRQIYREAHRVLIPGGDWIFCVTHPAFNDMEFTTYRNSFPDGRDYLKDGQQYQFVLKNKDGTQVTKRSFIDHHYPLSTYLNMLPQQGFHLRSMRELPVPGDMLPAYLIVRSTSIK